MHEQFADSDGVLLTEIGVHVRKHRYHDARLRKHQQHGTAAIE